jgi:hypothetical protein
MDVTFALVQQIFQAAFTRVLQRYATEVTVQSGDQTDSPAHIALTPLGEGCRPKITFEILKL